MVIFLRFVIGFTYGWFIGEGFIKKRPIYVFWGLAGLAAIIAYVALKG